jgi:hypothetical protein
MKKIKRYLLLLAVGSTGLFAGYSWLEGVVEDAFITVGTDKIEEVVKEEAEDRLKEKLFEALEGAFK